MSVEILQIKGYNFLWIDDYLWMWDLPEEIEIQQEMADQAYGRVVIVGCGLGVIQRMLDANPAVDNDSMLTIEKNMKVYDACREHGLDIPGGAFICDFFDSICGEDPGEKYDFVIGDICPEINKMYLDLYKKFKDKALEYLKPDGKILGWGQDYYEYLIEKEKRT